MQPKQPRSHCTASGRVLAGGNATFLMGVLCGLVIAALVEQLLPSEPDPDLAHYSEVRNFVQGEFVREVDPEEMLQLALHGMVEGLDSYSRYYTADEARTLERETRGRYLGIGVVFKPPASEGQVLFTLAGSPAERARIAVGDRLLSIDGRAVEGMTGEELRGSLSSTRPTDIELEIEDLEGERRRLGVRCESLIDPTVRHARMLDDQHAVGYLAITSFSNETPAEFDAGFRFLRERGMRSLVIDVRANYGGVLNAAVEIARRFIPEGVIVSTEGQGDPVIYSAEPAKATLQGTPLVVLVDGASASASEVLASALQDHRLAVVTGSPTYGKGLVQTIHHFHERKAVAKITTSYYYSPSHQNFERTLDGERDFGILPDLSVELSTPERRAVHTHLQRYSPPFASLPALAAWEAQSGESLIPLHPEDRQLAAAVALFRGERPGPFQAPGQR